MIPMLWRVMFGTDMAARIPTEPGVDEVPWATEDDVREHYRRKKAAETAQAAGDSQATPEPSPAPPAKQSTARRSPRKNRNSETTDAVKGGL